MRYFHLGEFFHTGWDASVKSRNLRRDPRVSVGIVALWSARPAAVGAQIFGIARAVKGDHADADGYWNAVRWQSEHVERP